MHGLAPEQVNPGKVGIWQPGWSPVCCRLKVEEGRGRWVADVRAQVISDSDEGKRKKKCRRAGCWAAQRAGLGRGNWAGARGKNGGGKRGPSGQKQWGSFFFLLFFVSVYFQVF